MCWSWGTEGQGERESDGERGVKEVGNILMRGGEEVTVADLMVFIISYKLYFLVIDGLTSFQTDRFLDTNMAMIPVAML